MINLKKSSFSLLELVFAMVIVGIVMTSIPMLLKTSSDNLETSNNEKYIFDSLELMSEINSKYFDENNNNNDNEKKVLTSNNGDSELKCDRRGITQLNNSGAECSSDEVTNVLGQETGSSDYNDVDDYEGYDDSIAKVNVSYIKDDTDYSSDTINFTLDTDAKEGSNSNIKLVTMSIKDDSGKIVAVLKYFASNIGQATIESKE